MAVITTTWDAALEWSDADNPNDVWTYALDGTAMNPGADWGSGNNNFFGTAQPAWQGGADDTPPMMYQSNGSAAGGSTGLDSPVGTLGCFGQPLSFDTSVSIIWTSPVAGDIEIIGGVWRMLGFGGNIVDWSLSISGAEVTDGSLADGVGSSGTPIDLGAGSGGASVLTTTVAIGDTVELAFTANAGSTFSDFTGFNLRVVYSETIVGLPCDNEYAIFKYADGHLYGSSSCETADSLFLDIDTPARDLIQITVSVEFIVNDAYLNPSNYIIIDTLTGNQLGVRKVLTPFNSPTSSRIMLVTDKHVSGSTYSVLVTNLVQRNGAVQDSRTGQLIARDAKANSMIGDLPNHFNLDPTVSTMRHVLQAITESDDRIGSL